MIEVIAIYLEIDIDLRWGFYLANRCLFGHKPYMASNIDSSIIIAMLADTTIANFLDTWVY